MKNKDKIRSISIAGVYMALGILFLKFIPMLLWGYDITFDASLHITSAIFVLFIGWYFIDQNKNWRIPYLIFSLVVLSIISTQRILVNAHNDVGLLLGLVVGVGSIMISNWKYFRKKLEF